MKYPDSASKAGLQGNVVLRFVILENGAIGDIKITKSLSEDCDEEAVRVIKSLPRFMPGKNQGKAVRVWYIIPVRFTMD